MDGIRATPMQYPILGLLADRLKKAQQFAIAPGGYANPPAEMLLNLLGVPAIQQTMERVAYGEPLTTGRGMTTQIRPEVAEAAMTLLPAAAGTARVAERGAMAAGRAGERMAERMVPKIMERGGMPAGLLSSFGQGTRSQIFVPASPQEAMQASKMLKAGVPKEKVWSDIGVVRGPDGEFRKEISDQMARISEARLPEEYIEGAGNVPSWTLGQSLLHPELYKEIPDLQGIQASFRSGDRALATYNPGMDWISYNKQAYQKGFITEEQQDKLLKAKKELDDFYKDENFIKYNEKIEKAFDENKDIEPLLNLELENKRNKLSDNYYGELNRIRSAETQGSTLGSGQSARGTTLHEVQHAVQERKGFAVGGSAEQFKDQEKAKEARDVLGWAKELRRKAEEMPGADSIAIDAALRKEYESLGAADWIPKSEIRDKALQPSILYPEKYDGQEAQRLEQLIQLYGLDRRTEPLSPDEVYRNLMGEAEARLVERRMNLTPEERRRYFPFEYTGKQGYGLDVKPEDLLYFNGKGQFIQRGLLD